MNLIEIVIISASVITSSTVIITALATAYKFIRKWDKWVKQKDKHDIEQYVQILRLVIMTPEMPLSERISAGDTYVNELHKIKNFDFLIKTSYNKLKTKGCKTMPIPTDPAILLSYINTQLRDNYPSLEELSKSLSVDENEIKSKLSSIGYEYNADLNRFV